MKKKILLLMMFMLTVLTVNATSYKVLLNLNYSGYEQKYDTILVENDKPINLTNWTVPTRTGYTFKGYYEGKDAENQYWHPTQYIDKNGKGVHNVNTNRDYEKIFYAHWTPKKFVLTFYTSVGELEEEIGIRPESPSHDIVTQCANLKINIDVEYDSKIADRLWSQDIITIRPGYKFLSLYDAEGNGEEIYRITDGGNSISAVQGIYWSAFGTEGRWIKDLGEDGDTLIIYPHYDPKFEIVEDGDRINFFNNDIQVRDIKGAIDEDNKLWNASPLVLDITQYTGYIQSGSNMIDNKGNVLNDGTQALNWLLSYYKDNSNIEPNCLTYLSPNSNYTTHDNVIRMSEKKCTNFVLTDRCRIKIPYTFIAEHAIYERDKGYDNTDGAVKQASISYWGTLCLPFPVTNDQNDITLYKLHAVNNNTQKIECKEYNKNFILDAGTPCVYRRKGLEIGSKITVEAQNVVVPINYTYSTKKILIEPNWEFLGTFKPLLFIGPKNSNSSKHPDWTKYTEEIYVPQKRDYELFYYKQNEFTKLRDNIRTYFHPYRAYFFDKSGNNTAKEITYTFEIINDETNINEIKSFNNKIYTLNGIKVNSVNKRNIYIINGKKIYIK